MGKTVKAPAKRPITPAMKRLIGTASALGFEVSNTVANAAKVFADTAAKLRKGFSAQDTEGLKQFGLMYRGGYMVRYYHANVAGYAKRTGNQSLTEKVDSMLDVIAKPSAQGKRPGRRTAREEAAVRAADVSWYKLQQAASLKQPPAKRKARPASNGNEPPRELVAATPNLKTKEAVNDHFATAFAALQATANLNAKRLTPQLSTIIETAYQACIKLGLIKSAK